MNINEIEHNVLENDFENDVQAHNIAFVWQRRSHRVPATRAVAIVHAIQALAVVLCEWIAVFLTTDSTTDMIGTDVCEAGVPNWPMACIKSLAVVALVALAATAYVTGNPDLLSIVGALTAVAALTGTIDVAVTISVRASDSSVKDALAADWVGVLQATVVLVCSAVVGCLLCVAIPRARDIWQHVDRAQAGRAPLVASASGLRAERRFLARTAVDGIMHIFLCVVAAVLLTEPAMWHIIDSLTLAAVALADALVCITVRRKWSNIVVVGLVVVTTVGQAAFAVTRVTVDTDNAPREFSCDARIAFNVILLVLATAMRGAMIWTLIDWQRERARQRHQRDIA